MMERVRSLLGGGASPAGRRAGAVPAPGHRPAASMPTPHRQTTNTARSALTRAGRWRGAARARASTPPPPERRRPRPRRCQEQPACPRSRRAPAAAAAPQPCPGAAPRVPDLAARHAPVAIPGLRPGSTPARPSGHYARPTAGGPGSSGRAAASGGTAGRPHPDWRARGQHSHPGGDAAEHAERTEHAERAEHAGGPGAAAACAAATRPESRRCRRWTGAPGS